MINTPNKKWQNITTNLKIIWAPWTVIASVMVIHILLLDCKITPHTYVIHMHILKRLILLNYETGALQYICTNANLKKKNQI